MRYMLTFLASAHLLAGALGCIPLTERGAKVRVIVGDPPNDCVEVGRVHGMALGKDARSYDSAHNALREHASEKGATHVRVEEKGVAGGGAEYRGTGFRCPNAARPAEIE